MAKSERGGRGARVVPRGDHGPDQDRAGGPVGEQGTLTEVATRRGPAEVRLDLPPAAARSLLVLGHGAGGSVDAPDLVAVVEALVPEGVAVARVTQPYRVAGRRAPAPANHLDEAWSDVVEVLRGQFADLPMVAGGRSSGARVACRTAAALGMVGVLALAFPTHPPGRPERSRVEELATGVPTLVVNGDRDPFGIPPEGSAEIRVVPGANHSLKAPAVVAEAALEWFGRNGWTSG